MNRTSIPLVLLASGAICVAALTAGGFSQETSQPTSTSGATDAAKLYGLVKQAREDVRQLRLDAGLHPHPAGPHIDPEGHHADDSPAQRRREQAEGAGHEDAQGHERGGDRRHAERERGEHSTRSREGAHRERERGEHTSRERGENREERSVMLRLAKHDKVYPNGARLVLQFNPNTEAFVGSVTNTTRRTLNDVRVEIHLSNGVELGPTWRTPLRPGATMPVELGAFGERFTTWTTHPETVSGHGESGEHSGPGHEARERGEHGGRGDRGQREDERGEHGRESKGERRLKPAEAQLHPVYNQIRLLQGELKAFRADLAAADG